MKSYNDSILIKQVNSTEQKLKWFVLTIYYTNNIITPFYNVQQPKTRH